ncbi:MAG: hypothetical protein Q9171_000592 [Xanthocarpia ochracea]
MKGHTDINNRQRTLDDPLPEDAPERSPRSTAWKFFLYGWWAVELVAFVASLACLIAIALVLNHYDGQARPDWPHNITLNSVLSWFTTLFKANLLVPIAACFGQANWIHYHSHFRPLADVAVYDAASRGPLGAIQLLWHLKAKYVASIGAIITILALGIDPIVQQTLSIGVGVRNATIPATIGRAQSFLQWDIEDYSTEVGISTPGANEDFRDPRVLLPPTHMVVAMFDGMFSEDLGTNSSISNIKLSCATGNCTFPPFQTLAVCSKCENVTDTLLSAQCHSLGAGGMRGPPYIMTSCERALPNGLKLNTTFGSSAVATNGTLAPVRFLPSSLSILNFTSIWSEASEASIECPPTSVKGSEYYCGDYNSTVKAYEEALKTKRIVATQCSLYWCVETMQTSVMNGQISETKLDTWYNKTALESDIVDDFLSSVHKGDIWTLTPPSLSPNDGTSEFVVARYASQALHNWLDSHLTISTGTTYVGMSVSFSEIDPYHRQYEQQRLMMSTNITTMFDKLVASMNRAFRRTSPESQRFLRYEEEDGTIQNPRNITGVGPAQGTATSREIYVVVHWHWLAFPIALWLIALLFFLLTLLSTYRRKLEVWKLSPLPLIFNRVDDSHLFDQPGAPLVQPVKISDMERKAAGLLARLEDCDVGPRLTTSESQYGYTPLAKAPRNG